MRKWSARDRAKIVLEVITGQRTVLEACRTYGVSESVYYRWQREFLDNGHRVFGSASQDQEACIRDLGCLVGQLALELEVLKKPPPSTGKGAVGSIFCPLCAALVRLTEGLFRFPEEKAVSLLFLPPSFSFDRPSRFPYLRVLGEKRLLGGPRFGMKELELLVLLLSRKEGWRGPELSEALYGEVKRTALKAVIHRLRKAGLQVDRRPYRLKTLIGADFLDLMAALEKGELEKALQLYRGPLLPDSQAPGIEELRVSLEEELKGAVLASQRKDLLYTLAKRLPEDLEVWETLLETLTLEDPRYIATFARVHRLRREHTL